MQTILRIRRLLVTSKCCCTVQIRNLALNYSFLRTRGRRKPKDIVEIPDVPKLWAKYSGMKISENNFKRLMLDELLEECKVNKDNSLHNLEKILIVQSDIESLIKRNLVVDISCIINGLLSSLEPFPFDEAKIGQHGSSLSIRLIRDEIEKQYLAWKYKLSVVDIEGILYRYRLCLYEFRSMGNLKRNIDILENMPKTAKLCAAQKIYHINQKPFSASDVKNFQDTIAGMNWQLFPKYCPKVLHHSHQYLLFVISTLRDIKFTEQQIQEGLPFLYLSFDNFIRRLNYIMTHPEISKSRDENKFLYLLSYPVHVLRDMVQARKATFVELTELITISSRSLTPRLKLGSAKCILVHIKEFFATDDSCVKILKRHSKYKLVSEMQIRETLMFLKSKQFKDDEVAESITLILYPRNLIEKTLEKIESDSKSLEKYGFKKGCVSEETNYFKHGTKEKRKLLQLCLYYLEKPFHFTGDGIWDCKVDNELDTEY